MNRSISPQLDTHRPLRSARGMTLVELMVTISLLALLLFAAVPSFSEWIRNTQIRSTAEKLQNGLRLARTQAMTLNRQVAFSTVAGQPGLNATAATNQLNWSIQTVPVVAGEVDHPKFIEGGAFAANIPGIQVVSATATLCFNSIGMVTANPTPSPAPASLAACTAQPATYVVQRTTPATGDRPLNVRVLLSGAIRMCDPARPSTAPDGCPP